jgi:hypothetical protein
MDFTSIHIYIYIYIYIYKYTYNSFCIENSNLIINYCSVNDEETYLIKIDLSSLQIRSLTNSTPRTRPRRPSFPGLVELSLKSRNGLIFLIF